MALLDDAIEAHGGLARWNKLQRFTLHLSIGGTLLSRIERTDRRKDLIAEGSTQKQSVRFTGLMDADRFGSFDPDIVTIENLDGEILRSWPKPAVSAIATTSDPLDELQLAFFCGFSIWNYLTTPFLLSRSDVEVEELSPWLESAQPWRRLRALFPPHLISHSHEQIFYFDESGLQRRTDHQLGDTMIAHFSWAHQRFNNITVPTLRRSQLQNADGTVAAKPVLFDIEIFDAAFE
jgi:hypothetical protein